MKNKKKYIKALGNAVSALSILFITAALLRIDLGSISIKNIPLFLLLCAVCIAIKTATVYLMGSAWRRWLEFFSGRRCDRKEAMRVYAKANIGKYLPGNVMHYVERNLFAGRLELSQKQIAGASLIEVCSLILAALLLGVTAAFRQLEQAVSAALQAVSLPRGVSVALVLSAAAAGMLAMVYLYRKKLGEARKKGFVKNFLACFLTYLLVLAMLGAILVFLYGYQIAVPSAGDALQMISAYIIAWVLGFVVPGAPGGIGVRELVLTLLLTPLMGQDSIVMLGVLHRLITVAGDFAAYALRGVLFCEKGKYGKNG